MRTQSSKRNRCKCASACLPASVGDHRAKCLRWCPGGWEVQSQGGLTLGKWRTCIFAAYVRQRAKDVHSEQTKGQGEIGWALEEEQSLGELREAHGNCPGRKGSVGGDSRGLMGMTRQTGRGVLVVEMTEPGMARVLNTLFRSLGLLIWEVQANADLCKQNTSSVSVLFF